MRAVRFIENLDRFDDLENHRPRRPRIIHARTNYFDELDDIDFFRRFRMTKPTVMSVLELIENELEFDSNRNQSLSPINQLLLALRFYATGSFLLTMGDFSGVSVSTSCRVVNRVSSALANLRGQFIKFPTTQREMAESKRSFFDIAGFPNVLGAIDCTHVKIQSPESKIVVCTTSTQSTTFTTSAEVCGTSHKPSAANPASGKSALRRSHDKHFTLFRLGQKSTAGVKAFAESGKSDLLEEQSQGGDGVFDEFSAPSISAGVGRTETQFFVDGNHSKVSLMSCMVPSPDWFIGIDSFDLCVNGNWLDSITIEVDPIDAGTDNGFTFTAPNWPTDPQGEAYKITAHYPAHPAGSFFYPYLKRLPPIGTFQFIKIKEYELSEVFHHEEDEHQYEVLKMEQLTHNTIGSFNGNNDIQTAIEEEREEQEQHQKFKPKPRILKEFTLSTPYSTTPLKNGFYTVESRIANSISQRDNAPTSPPIPAVVPKGNKNAIMNSIADSYLSHKDRKHKKYHKIKRTYAKKYRPPRDCRVSEWSQWSVCSKSCGIGEMQRRREVLKHARRGGRLCPPLVETKWCGSARTCKKEYFNCNMWSYPDPKYLAANYDIPNKQC